MILILRQLNDNIIYISSNLKIDGFVKSSLNLSFRAKREIFSPQPIENIRFLPTVEMTNSMSSTFYEFIKIRVTIEKEGFLIADTFLNGK